MGYFFRTMFFFFASARDKKKEDWFPYALVRRDLTCIFVGVRQIFTSSRRSIQWVNSLRKLKIPSFAEAPRKSFRQRVDSKGGRGGERVSAASFHRGRRRGETGTPRLAIGRDGKNARGHDSTRRPDTKKRPNDRAFLSAVRPVHRRALDRVESAPPIKRASRRIAR